MGSQKLGAYEVRYKWKIQNSTSSVKWDLDVSRRKMWYLQGRVEEQQGISLEKLVEALIWPNCLTPISHNESLAVAVVSALTENEH